MTGNQHAAVFVGIGGVGAFLVALRLPAWPVAIAAGVLALMYALWRYGNRASLHARLLGGLGLRNAAHLRTHSKHLPRYRFVDVFRAAERWCKESGIELTLDAYENAYLGSLLAGNLPPMALHGMEAPAQPFVVGPSEEEFFPIDRFWLRRRSDGVPALALRVRIDPQTGGCLLEVAGEKEAHAQQAIEAILEIARAESIYRGRVLSMGTSSMGIDDVIPVGGSSYAPLTIHFSDLSPVPADDIVLDEDVREILIRNVVSLQNDRRRLARRGVSTKRGVLLYGPPGTGKTFACRHLFGLLDETTVITVTGQALVKVNEIFELARMLEPALIVFEDVDLVFSARDTNMYSSTLGDLMDQLDGLGPDAGVSVLLTTNAIERLEAAIKDRPGRISQVVHFGPPNAELRRRYLARYLRDHAAAAVDLETLVRLSERTTQAFLKEWVNRALQFASERVGEGSITLSTEDFEQAMREMRRFSEAASGIVGFR